jgi:ABC-type amino acid transport substrate-binding protein
MTRRLRWMLAIMGVLALLAAGCTNQPAEEAAEESGDVGEAPATEAAAADAGGGGESHLDQILERGTLRVGMTLQFEPQMYRDENNEPAGYDVELMNLMAEDLGVELEINDQEFDGLIPGLIADQFDLISVGLVNTPERAQTIWFSEPYVPYRQVVVRNTQSPITQLEDLDSPDARITALTGSTAANLVGTQFPQAELVELEQQPAFLEVASGRADAIVVEEYLARPFVAENDGVEILNPDEPFAEEFGAYALPSGDIEWKTWVDNWVRYHTDRGTLDALYRQIIEPSFEGG